MGGNTGGWGRRQRERGERGLLPLCAPLILLMVLKGLAGKQMLFCEMDSIFFPPLQTWFSPSSRGHKVLFQYENGWWGPSIWIQFKAENSNLWINLASEYLVYRHRDELYQLSLCPIYTHIVFTHLAGGEDGSTLWTRYFIFYSHLMALRKAKQSRRESLPGTQTQ